MTLVGGVLRRLSTQAALAAVRNAPAAPAPEALSALARDWAPRSRRTGVIGRKAGMMSVWDKWGEMRPITVVELQDNVVVQAKTMGKEGVDAVQVGAGWQKQKRVRKSEWRHFELKGIELKRDVGEFQVSADAVLPVGTRIVARHFAPGQLVDVQGTTKGKGFAGVMKRHGFKGQPASHGVTKAHRKPGSNAGGTNSYTGGKVIKGKKMPGNMGNKTVTTKNVRVYKVDVPRNLLFLLGSIPGAEGGVVRVTDAKSCKRLVPEGADPPPFPTFLPDDAREDVRAAPGPPSPLRARALAAPARGVHHPTTLRVRAPTRRPTPRRRCAARTGPV